MHRIANKLALLVPLLLFQSLFVRGDTPPIQPVKCSSDTDCNSLTASSGVDKQAVFLCVQNVCSLAVAAGFPCERASDCAQFQWTQRKMAAGKSLDYILQSGYQPGMNATKYLQSLCDPSYCTISSFCSPVSSDFYSYAPSNPLVIQTYQGTATACCAGGPKLGICSSMGTQSKVITTCSGDNSCVNPPTTSNLTTEQICNTADQTNTLWIGIIICIIGAAGNNIGLNLQKLALRQRSEMESRKKREKQIFKYKIGAMRNFPGSWSSSIKKKINNILFRKPYANVDFGTDAPSSEARATALPEGEVVSSPQTVDIPTEDILDSDTLRSPNHADQQQVMVEETTTTVIAADDHLPISLVEHKEGPVDLEKKLNFQELIKTPIWVLGMTVYICSNFINFAALQFAPQSLVAPLGSISLVVNIIAAPMINKEKWSWKDIVGSTFIVGGSSMTIVFAGTNSIDLTLCVLKKVFTRPSSIVFLITTISLGLSFFMYICVVEKNVEKAANDTPKSEDIGDVTITTTTTTVTIPARRHSENHLAELGIADVTDTYPMGNLPHHENHPSLIVEDLTLPLPQAAASPAIENPSPIEWTSSLYRSVYSSKNPNSVGGRMSRLFGRPLTPSLQTPKPLDSPVVASPLTPKSPRIRSALGQVKVNTSGTALQSEAAGNSDGVVERRPSLAEMQQSEFKISDVDDTIAHTQLNSRHSEGSAEDVEGDMDDISPVISTASQSSASEKKKKSWKFKLYKAMPLVIRKGIDRLASVELIPRFRRKFKLTDKVVTIGLPLSYASLGGLMGTLCTLFAKSTIHLLTGSFAGTNQFNDFFSWVVLGVTVFTAFAQVYWINMGLQRYDALLQIPVFFVVWTVFDVIGGGIYFDEFAGFTAKQFGLFILAIGVIFLGVFVLGDRLKRSHV